MKNATNALGKILHKVIKPGSIFFLAIITLALFYTALPPTHQAIESTDIVYYYQPAAINLLDGRGLTTDNGHILTRYPPGYAVTLAVAIFTSRSLNIDPYYGIYAFTWAAFGLISVIIYLIANQYWKNGYAIIPSLLWMTYLPALWSAKQPNSEIPFILFFLIGVWLLIKVVNRKHPKWSQFAVTGLVFGLSMLIRPIALPIGVLLFLFLLLFLKPSNQAKKLPLAACFFLGSYVPALVWGVYLQKTTNQFVLLSTNGTRAVIDGLTFTTNEHATYRENNILTERLKSTQNFQTSFMERNPSSMKDIITIIAEEAINNPIGVMQLFLIKAARAWYALDSMRFETYIIPYQAFYLLLISISWILSVKHGYIPQKTTVLVAVLVFSFWGMTTLALSILRYMVPVFPLLFIFTPSIFTRIQPTRTAVEASSVVGVDQLNRESNA